MTAGLTVYIVDDHRLFREALVKLVSTFPRIASVKEVSGGHQLFRLMRQAPADVVILDLEMPAMDGFSVCDQLVNHYPDVKILIVSMHDGKAHIYTALEAGAHAFLSKNSDCDELEQAIHSIVDVGIYRNRKMLEALQSRMLDYKLSSAAVTDVRLTEREISIVRFIAQGYTTRQIGEKLTLSENTIRNHKVRIMRKLGVKNISGLVKHAVENGLVRP
jgi:two-component system, NarL family, response regulator DegU